MPFLKFFKKSQRKELVLLITSALLVAILAALSYFTYETWNQASVAPTGGVGMHLTEFNEVYPDWIYMELAPGESLETKVSVVNFFPFKVTAYMSAVDALGGTTLEQFNIHDETAPKDWVGGWISFEEEAPFPIELGEDETREIPFKVTVPAETELGDYYGAITVSVTGRDASEDNPVATVMRVGMRVIVKVTDDPQSISLLSENPNSNSSNRFYLRYGALSITIIVLAVLLIIFSQTKLFSRLYRS